MISRVFTAAGRLKVSQTAPTFAQKGFEADYLGTPRGALVPPTPKPEAMRQNRRCQVKPLLGCATSPGGTAVGGFRCLF